MRILSVNVGAPRDVIIKHREVQTSIYKTPLHGRIKVHRLGLEGDARIEPRKMGAEHHAVYAYPFEHYGHWQQVLDREPFPMGQFGENLTISGLLEEEVRIGDVLRFGNTVLQVAHPRIPCAKLNHRMGFHFSSMFLASRKVGFYLRVLQEGDVGEGDGMELLERDPDSPTIEEFVRITHYEYWDAQGLLELLNARDLMPAWKETIKAKLERALSADGWQGLREFEIVQLVEEDAGTVSLHLKCIRGRPLAPYRPGQVLGIVLGGRSAQQQRRAYPLSGNPEDLSAYRIIVKRRAEAGKNQPDAAVTAHLLSSKIGEHLFCTAPHWGSLGKL